MRSRTQAVEDRSMDDPQTVAATDEIDGESHLVVADITRDDAWLAIEETAATSIQKWR